LRSESEKRIRVGNRKMEMRIEIVEDGDDFGVDIREMNEMMRKRKRRIRRMKKTK
jgi:hypothetical protein